MNRLLKMVHLHAESCPNIDIDAFTTFGKGSFLGISIPVVIMFLAVVMDTQTKFL